MQAQAPNQEVHAVLRNVTGEPHHEEKWGHFIRFEWSMNKTGERSLPQAINSIQSSRDQARSKSTHPPLIIDRRTPKRANLLPPAASHLISQASSCLFLNLQSTQSSTHQTLPSDSTQNRPKCLTKNALPSPSSLSLVRKIPPVLEIPSMVENKKWSDLSLLTCLGTAGMSIPRNTISIFSNRVIQGAKAKRKEYLGVNQLDWDGRSQLNEPT